MINRVIHSDAAVIGLQQAAELRAKQSASSAEAAQQASTKSNFAELFGGNYGAAAEAATPSSKTAATAATVLSHGGFDTAIAAATANIMGRGSRGKEPATAGPTRTTSTVADASKTAASTTASTTTTASASTTTSTTTTGTAATTAATATAATASTTAATTATVTTPGVEALVTAIMNGSFKATYVTDPSQLQETTPAGTDTMPNFYYASDQTAAQLAQLLGGTVVQMPAFGQDKGFSEPNANFIQLPNGQTFNAADVAYYAKCGSEGASQLTADITSTINEGSAWTNYYQQGGQMPIFAEGYVGPAITGMSYPSSMVAANGDVINPAMQQSGT
jgi:anti-sigma28 factor (negative regulator of flagellin synthesis)